MYLQAACINKAADTLGPWTTADNYQAAGEVLKDAHMRMTTMLFMEFWAKWLHLKRKNVRTNRCVQFLTRLPVALASLRRSVTGICYGISYGFIWPNSHYLAIHSIHGSSIATEHIIKACRHSMSSCAFWMWRPKDVENLKRKMLNKGLNFTPKPKNNPRANTEHSTKFTKSSETVNRGGRKAKPEKNIERRLF